MTKLSDIIPIIELVEAIDEGLVRYRTHPTDENLAIFNYTEKAQYTGTWTRATRNARGLIVRLEPDVLDGDVVARPWPKFFNYGQHEDGALDLGARVEVTDKMDGSLGILYVAPDGPAIATRGSFTSEQARHATAVLRARYVEHLGVLAKVAEETTLLFEIIYPDNRIVVDYGTRDELVLLGGVSVSDGDTYGIESTFSRWTGPRAHVFHAWTLADALALPPRPNAEGLVVRYPDTGLMVKIKQDDYVRLHRIVTGLNERAVWEHLRDHGGTYHDLLAAVPDEFHGWVSEKAETLAARWNSVYHQADAEWHRIRNTLLETRGGYDRKEFAGEAVKHEHRSLLFLLEDARDPSDAIWKLLRPAGESESLMNRTEDVA